MPTPAERSALLFVAAVAALGLGVRGCRAVSSAPPPPADREALARQLAAVDSAIAEGGRRPTRRAPKAPTSPRAPGGDRGRTEPPPRPDPGVNAETRSPAPARGAQAQGLVGSVDPDRATAEELDRLPGIGPALAARIVASRDSAGPFGSVDGLQRVRGIGPALAAKIAPHVTFSGRPPPSPR